MKLCECGCGKPTKIATMTSTRAGVRKGDPRRFLRGHFARLRAYDWSNLAAYGVRDEATGCLIWPFHRNGYGYGVIHAKKGESAVLVHRFVLERSVGRELRSDEFACHTCDRPECFEVSHLWVGDAAENVADAKRKGRAARGSRAAQALLSEANVHAIHDLLRGGTAHALCAELFGVRTSTINAIRRGQNWGHIPFVPASDGGAFARTRRRASPRAA